MSLPVADPRGRRINDEIRTLQHRAHKLVEARFQTTRSYSHPDEAPPFARLRFHRGQWTGDIELSEYATDEITALTRLAETLLGCGFEEQAMLTHTLDELEKVQSVTSPPVSADGRTKQQRSTRASNLGAYLGRKAANDQETSDG